MELARKQPALFLIFDIVVADDGEMMANHNLRDRRARLGNSRIGSYTVRRVLGTEKG
jgi:hypothetical protein